MDKAFMPVQEQVTRSCNSCTITLYRGKFPYKLVWQRKPIFLLSLKKEIPQTHHVNLHRTAAGAPELYNSPWIMDPGFCGACHRLREEKKKKHINGIHAVLILPLFTDCSRTLSYNT